MGQIPDRIETDRQPPLTVPLGHFVIGFAFLLLGGFMGAADGAGLLSGMSTLAHTHLLLAGWICVTILGAMTQFVPVWSGVSLYSERLAAIQLWLVAIGLLGFAGIFTFGPLSALAIPAAVMLAGFWVFVYNIARTLARLDSLDVTEAHFAVALVWFLIVTTMGFLLALGFAYPGLLADAGLIRFEFRLAHATAAVFGAVLTTVFGALYQLSQMFTQASETRLDLWLQRLESVTYTTGITLLFAGRLLGIESLAIVGGGLAVVGVLAVASVLGSQLLRTRTEWSPVLSRYAVVAVSLLAWALVPAPAWVSDPLSPDVTLGTPLGTNILVFGVLVFIVMGTLYHVVPFIVWFHRYSDRLGLEAVPMVEELYDGRLAVADFWLVFLGGAAMVLGAVTDLPAAALAVGGTLTTVGFVVFAANMIGVIRGHSPHSLPEVLLAGFADEQSETGG